jgi:hypothetical protein
MRKQYLVGFDKFLPRSDLVEQLGMLLGDFRADMRLRDD